MPDFKSGVLAKAAKTIVPVQSQRLLLYIQACQHGEADPHPDAEVFVRHEGFAPSPPRISEMRRILKLSTYPACGAVLNQLDREQPSFAILATVMIDIHRHLKLNHKAPTRQLLDDWIETARSRTQAWRPDKPTRTRTRSDLKPSAVRLTKEILLRLDALQEFYGKRSGANLIAASRKAMQAYQPHAKKAIG